MVKYIKKKSLSYHILLGLEKAVDGYVRLEDLGHRSYRYTYGYPNVPASQLSQALKRLRIRGLLIQDKIDQNKVIFKLTELGKDALGGTWDADEWDGKWRLVIFDIPEQRRNVRKVLRSRLKIWGFVPWQKSVWATKQDVMSKLTALIKELKIEDWVALVESNNVFIPKKQ